METVPGFITTASRGSLINAASSRREETKGRNRITNSDSSIQNRIDSRRPTNALQTEESKTTLSGEVARFEWDENGPDAENVLTLYLPQHENVSSEHSEIKSDKFPEVPVTPSYSSVPAESRAVTAPARPRTELEKFRASGAFACLENAAICASQLIQRSDNKFDLDSGEGLKNCKKLLGQVESMCVCFKIQCGSRKYRNKFSQAYRVLYCEGSLCYLTEILDAAQERIVADVTNRISLSVGQW